MSRERALDDSDYDEMLFRIYDSTQYDYAVALIWANDQGAPESGWGLIGEIDPERMRIKLVCNQESRWIHLPRLLHVRKM